MSTQESSLSPIMPYILEIERLELENGRLRAERLKLDKRIHNQRVNLRRNWEIVEMRANYKALPPEVRSRFLKGWCATHRELVALRAQNGTAGQSEGGSGK